MTETSAPPEPVTPDLIRGPASLPQGDYAIVEALGHRTLVGRVAEVERFGASFLQVEPLFADLLLGPVLLGGSSIYQFTPCTPAVAWDRRAKHRYELPPSVAALVPDEPDPGRFDATNAPAFIGFNSRADDWEQEQ